MEDQSVLLSNGDCSSSRRGQAIPSRLLRSVLSLVFISATLWGITGASPAAAATSSHTGTETATHMQLKNSSGKSVCHVYNTSPNSKPVAQNCPTGSWTEQLFDANWKQIGHNKTVTVGGTTNPGTDNPGPDISQKRPTLRSANYFFTQAIASGNVPSGPPRGVALSWDRVNTYADGVKIYRDNVLQTTVTNGIRWKDPQGRPGAVYHVVAIRGNSSSKRSQPVTATVEWFREHDHSDAEARIRGRLYSSHLTDASVDQIVEAAAAALGDRPDLITKWHRDAGGEIQPYTSGGLVKCSNAYHDTRIYLPNNPSAFLTVHELAHVLDCSKSGQWRQNGDVDGIGTGMYSWDEAKLVSERERIWALNSSGNRPAWLRAYSFTNRAEFFADVSSFFLTDEARRIQMAIEAPVLYDTLRSYYYKPWAPAAEIALVESNP